MQGVLDSLGMDARLGSDLSVGCRGIGGQFAIRSYARFEGNTSLTQAQALWDSESQSARVRAKGLKSRSRDFSDYAILGDDVVIADDRVAAQYEQAIGMLGVKISYQKSLISNTGCAEFAKRFKVHGLRKDLSQI